MSTAKLLAGQEVEPSGHFPFLAEADHEMDPDEQEDFLAGMAREMGGTVNGRA